VLSLPVIDYRIGNVAEIVPGLQKPVGKVHVFTSREGFIKKTSGPLKQTVWRPSSSVMTYGGSHTSIRIVVVVDQLAELPDSITGILARILPPARAHLLLLQSGNDRPQPIAFYNAV